MGCWSVGVKECRSIGVTIDLFPMVIDAIHRFVVDSENGNVCVPGWKAPLVTSVAIRPFAVYSLMLTGVLGSVISNWTAFLLKVTGSVLEAVTLLVVTDAPENSNFPSSSVRTRAPVLFRATMAFWIGSLVAWSRTVPVWASVAVRRRSMGVMECRSIGVIEYRSIGEMGYRGIGVMEYWGIGVFVCFFNIVLLLDNCFVNLFRRTNKPLV